MAEIRGTDLVVEYLIREKVPYLFGYAGHGAVGLLDGVYPSPAFTQGLIDRGVISLGMG